MRGCSFEYTADQVEAALKHFGVEHKRSDLFRNDIESAGYTVVGLTISGRVFTSNSIVPLVERYLKQMIGGQND